MFLNSIGIILKKNELSLYKLIILDKVQGKIECVSPTSALSTGSLITYNLIKKGSTHFISDSALVYIPLSLAQIDMLFFHHVLELIYYFTNVGNCSQKVFDLLAFLYSTEEVMISRQSKKFFLLKLLTSMDSLPEIPNVRTDVVIKLNALDIHQLNQITINISHEKELDRWLWCCVWQHPYVNEFKTVHFLVENRAI